MKKTKNDNKQTCCICGSLFNGFGNNPWPIKNEGICCNACNEIVINERIRLLTK